MDGKPGLRQRKKDATRSRLILTALELFEEHGFDNVSVAEIAEAAEVSKKTVFNYFGIKEDLILGAGEHHQREPAAVVRERPSEVSVHAAMRDYLRTALDERQPFTGLNDNPVVLRIQQLVRNTPQLAVRYYAQQMETRRLLAEALMEEGSSRFSAFLVAAQILSAQEVVVGENVRRITEGETPDEVYPDAVRAAEHAFHLLENGLGGFDRELRHAAPGSPRTAAPDPSNTGPE
ncbi:TetR/AcrR family transcriptional regulator [Sciscionella sediminilitoris]|uniref:TetR/AcrR family transcriptional regulator n=1 Tax=Sciscionella sediminilitoris TaxID=1445613 RepID=UPI0007C6A7E5|nr:TetR/AcrR family transcriptional regulator [Sciscionella sp. SE31]